MKITVEDITPVKKRLRVEIEADEVNRKLNQAYGDIRNKVRIPGFRPGKAPRKILESYYGNQVREDVTKELIADSFPKAVDEAKTFPLGQPVLEKESLKQGDPFFYSAIMEVRPQFEVKNYLGLEIQKEILSVSDDDVQNRLEEIRKANGKLTSIAEKRPIREGDYAIVDYKGFENGQPMEGIHSSNLLVKIGKNDFHPKFDEALVGLVKDDETEIDIDFEKDFYHSRLAGKQVHFKTKVVDIKELALPELDDAFASSLGSDFKDLETLRYEIRKAITSENEKRIDGELKQRLIEKVSEGLDFELPDVLVEAETDFSVNRFKNNLERGGASIEKMGLSEEGMKKEFRPLSEKRVREMLILEQIAKQAQITVTVEDLEEGYRELALHMGQDTETVKKYYEAQDQVESLKEELLKQKTLKYLVDHAKVLEVQKDELGQKKDREAGEG
jgi:trigger factor